MKKTIPSFLYFAILYHSSLALAVHSSYQKVKATVTAQPHIPMKIPEAGPDDIVYLKLKDGTIRPLTIIPQLQANLKKYLRHHGNPIATVIMTHVKTGHIIAMAQGRSPLSWNAKSHSALHPEFPAASLFKTVTTAAALELAHVDPLQIDGLMGGCQKVNSRGTWMRQVIPNRFHKITLEKAFAQSCNGYFAKLAIQELGLGIILNFAKKLGWNERIPTDFLLPPSPMNPPSAVDSGIHSIGRFAAGFGMVGISAVHAAWMNLVIANNGKAKKIFLFLDSQKKNNEKAQTSLNNVVLSENTALQLRDIMARTVTRGTAASAFRKRGYRHIRQYVSGKTGTLTGTSPQGSTTWFAGIMSYNKTPEIVVSSVVVNRGKWIIKGPHLAAEAFRQWHKFKKNRTAKKS